MDFLLQEHQAKHVYRIPDGLREICTDISREVLREQPKNIYSFVADYLDALLITRENAKVALRVVRNIVDDNESIIAVLKKTGLSFEQIAVAAPRLQKTFRDYLDAVDIKPGQNNAVEKLEKESHVSIGNILKETGATLQSANRAATLIQAAFRGHYRRMLEREKNGEIQWQRAVMNTMKILRKAGISQSEASRTATLIQSAYRSYYTRRNTKLKTKEEEDEKIKNYLEPKDTIQAVAWLDMMLKDSGLTFQRVNEAASKIQKAFRKYRREKISKETPKSISTRTLTIGAILDHLNQKVFHNILERSNFPKELGSSEELSKSLEKIQSAHRTKMKTSQYFDEFEGEERLDFEEQEDFGEDFGEVEIETTKSQQLSEERAKDEEELEIEDNFEKLEIQKTESRKSIEERTKDREEMMEIHENFENNKKHEDKENHRFEKCQEIYEDEME